MDRDPHPSSTETAYLGLDELRGRLARGSVTSVSLVETLLSRIAALDGADSPCALRSVVATSASVLDEAAAADQTRSRGGSAGALAGIPVLVKDNIEVVGLPSTAGSTALYGRPPRADAELVARLRQAGALVLGTTNLSEWANLRSSRSTSGWSAVGGLCANPWAFERSAGGSSSGSGAALAAGLSPLAIGTETDGSITCPASLNGVVGIKPTVGTVPTVGVVPISASQDSPGPMARSVAEVAALLDVLAATTGTAVRAAAGIEGCRVGVAITWRTGHPGTDELFDDAVAHFTRAGAVLIEVAAAMPGPGEGDDELTVLLAEMADDLGAYLAARPGEGARSLAELVAFNEAHASDELGAFGQEHFTAALALGGRRSPTYAEARRRNLDWALRTCLGPALAGVDVLVAPAYAPAWKSDLLLGDRPEGASPVTTAPAICGWPVATVPMGLVGGLPVGLSLVGRPGSEGLLLACAQAVEDGAGLLAAGLLRPTWLPPGRG
jgi:amidase